MSNNQTLPTPNVRRSFHDTRVLIARREGALAASSESCRDENLGRLQPRTLKPPDPARLAALHTTIRPFAGNDLGCRASRSSLRRSPELGGGRPISRAKANALAAEGNAGEDHGAGLVIGVGGNPHPTTAGRGLVAQPVGVGGDLGGGAEAQKQFGDGSSRTRPMRSAWAKRPEPPSSTTTRSLPGPGQPQPCGRSSKQQSNKRLAALLVKQHCRQDRLTTVRTTSA